MEPTITLTIGESVFTRDERGEILETVERTADGSPDWTEAGICDARGMGGADGFDALRFAFISAERAAEASGEKLTKV